MNYRSKYYKLILLWLAFPTCIISQADLLFHDVSQGLSQKTVTAITQDNQGFIWVGTFYGLCRYDGVEYKNYLFAEDNINTISNNRITSLQYDKIRNLLWIGTYGGGLNQLDLNNSTFSQFQQKVGNNDYITDLHLDDQLLWIATEKSGLNVMNLQNEKFIDKVQSFNLNQIKSKYITSLSPLKNKMMVGTWEDGLLILDLKKGIIIKGKETSTTIRCIEQSSDSSVLIGSNLGLYTAIANGENIDIEKVENFPLNNAIVLSVAYSEKKKSIYIGTENKGLVVIDNDGSSIVYKTKYGKNTILGNSIWSIYEDQTGIMWLGFFYKGLAKIDAQESKFFDISRFEIGDRKIELGLVNSITETDELLWIGTDGDGLYSYNRSKDIYAVHDIWEPNSPQVVTSLLKTVKEELWVSTWGEGIIIVNPVSGQVLRRIKQTDGLSGNFIHSMHLNSRGEILVSCFGNGLDIYKEEKKINTFSENELLSSKIRAVCTGCDNQIFLGTEESGVQFIELNENGDIINSRIFLDNTNTSSTYQSVNDIIVDKECNAWFCTNSGLYYWNAKNDIVKKYNSESGLPSDMIVSALQDIDGNIWGTTNKGVFLLLLENDEVRTFSLSDGLSTNEFIAESKFTSKDGLVFFGNNSGINYFNPKNKGINEFTTAPLITRILVANKNITANYKNQNGQTLNGGEIELAYNQNDIFIEFAMLNLTQSKENKYQIKLEGLDPDWVNWESKRTVEYRNLQPGNYTFKVKGANNDGVWHEGESTYKIQITKAWYNSLVAWFLYLLFFLGGIIYIMTNILARQKLKSELVLEHIENDKLKEISQLKSKFFANISHELNTPLTMIISPLKGFLSKNRKEVEISEAKTMLNNAERLQNHIRQILDLAKLDTGHISLKISRQNFSSFIYDSCKSFEDLYTEKSITINKAHVKSNIYIYFDEYRMEQILSNLLSNAYKYSNENSQVNISLTESMTNVILEIRDKGIGISSQHLENIFDRFFRERDENKIGGTGLGLSITKQLTEIHGGSISVKSELGSGTTFTLQFLKGSSHFDSTQLVITESKTLEINRLPSQQIAITNETFETNDVINNQLPILLIAEDNADIRNFLRSYFQEEYNVIVAKDGMEAFELSKEHIPDVVITDLMMPNRNGFVLCKDLKTDMLTSHIAIIMLSVKSSEESQIKGMKYGADHYVTKPFNPELLKLRVNNILNFKNKFNPIRKRESNLIMLRPQLTELDLQFIAKVKNIILSNIADFNFGVSDLCVAMCLSKSQLYRKLKAISEMSPNEFIRNTKLEESAKLIKEGQLNISEITYKVGFNDLQYFRKCFKDKYGMPPSKYS